MNIYVTHSTSYDFRSELYAPLKAISNGSHTFILPHETDETFNSKEIIRSSDLVLAEVSYPSTGQGIELGWANDSGISIICLHKAGARFSSSLHFICDTFIEYTSPEDMIQKLEIELNRLTQTS